MLKWNLLINILSKNKAKAILVPNNVNKYHTLPDGFLTKIGQTDPCLKRFTGSSDY